MKKKRKEAEEVLTHIQTHSKARESAVKEAKPIRFIH